MWWPFNRFLIVSNEFVTRTNERKNRTTNLCLDWLGLVSVCQRNGTDTINCILLNYGQSYEYQIIYAAVQSRSVAATAQRCLSVRWENEANEMIETNKIAVTNTQIELSIIIIGKHIRRRLYTESLKCIFVIGNTWTGNSYLLYLSTATHTTCVTHTAQRDVGNGEETLLLLSCHCCHRFLIGVELKRIYWNHSVNYSCSRVLYWVLALHCCWGELKECFCRFRFILCKWNLCACDGCGGGGGGGTESAFVHFLLFCVKFGET